MKKIFWATMIVLPGGSIVIALYLLYKMISKAINARNNNSASDDSK